MQVYAVKRWHLAGLLLIVLLAVFLRAGDGLAGSHFRYDQAQLSLLALQMANGDALPLVGIQSSAGVPNSPMTVYFLAPFFALSDNPQIVTLMLALWNVFGVGLLWWIGHRYFSPMVGLLASLAYAVNPWAVFYSRSIWAQNYHTPLILMGIALALYGFVERRRWAQFLCWIPLFIGMQIHFAAYTLLPAFGVLLIVHRKRVRWRAVFAGIVLAALTFVPFVLGLSQAGEGAGSRADTILSIVRGGVLMRWYPVEQVRDLITGLGLEFSINNQIEAFQAVVVRLDVLWYGMLAFALVGCALLWRRRWRHLAIFMWLWAFITLIAFIPAWTGSGVFHHYFVPSIPAFALLAAIGLVGLQEFLLPAEKANSARLSWHLRSAGVMVLYGIFVVVMINQVLWWQSLNDFRINVYNYNERNRQTATPVQYLMDIRDALQDYEDVIIAGGNPHESNYYIWTPMLYETASCVRDLLIVDGEIDILPEGEFAVVVPPLTPYNTFYNVPERYQHDEPIIVELRPGEDPYMIYPFAAAPEWRESEIVDVPETAFDNGIALSGYMLGEALLQLRWQVNFVSGESYQYFVHFLDEGGDRVGQRDAPFYVGQHWCEGDTLITTTSIELPADTATLRIGMYRFREDGGTESQGLRDNSAAKWVDIAIVSD